MSIYNITTEQIEKVTIDTGVVYLNYGETNQTKLAPCEGANSFVVEQEVRDIPYNGRRGKTKGLRRILRQDATLTCSVLNLSQENIKLALAGAKVDELTGVITSGDGFIPDTDYLKNVTIIGETLDGEYKRITINNGLGDNGLNISMEADGEATVEIAFAAHYDPANLDAPIYEIEDLTEIATGA